MSSKPFTIDREFAELCPPLTSEERSLLRASIESEGCQQPVVVWAEERLLLDGHNRSEICEQLGKEYGTRDLSLPSRDAAIEWIIANQLGRRNVTEEQKAYLRGKRYRHEKQKPHRPEKGGQNVHLIEPKKTAQRIAEETGVDEKTVRRDAKFSEAVDTLAKNIGPHIRGEILTGQANLSKQAVVAIAQKPAERQLAEVAAARTTSPRLTIAQPNKPKPIVGKSPIKAIQDSDKCWALISEIHALIKSPTLVAPYSEIKRLFGELRETYRKRYHN